MARGLTALKIENSRPTGQRREIADAGKPGLYLVIQPTGKKSWAVRYRRLSDKQSRKYTLPGFASLGVARQQAQKVLDSVALGEDPAAQKQIDKRAAHDQESDNFEDVAIRFIERDQKPANRTWKETARLLGLKEGADGGFEIVADGIADRWGKRPVSQITKREIIDLLDGMVEDAPVMANRTLAAIRRLFNWCVEKDIITISPCAGIKPPAEESSRRRVLSDIEIASFWKACSELKFPFGDAGKLLLLTGARRSEVSDMTRGEIKGALWTIPRERSKHNEPHSVPLSGSALQVLGAVPKIKGEAGFVFTTTGDTPISGWSRAKTQIDEFMGVEDWRLHDLRRTVASGMARLGIKLEVIEKCLNHTSGSFGGIVGVYQLHSYEDEKREAVERWGQEVERIVVGKTAGVIRLRGRG